MQHYVEPSFERIRRIRLVRKKYLKDTNCSDQRFSKLIGIKPIDLKKIESHKKEISLSVFQGCSKIFGVSVDHLVSDKIMWEDQFNEPILFKVQIGSVMHAIRTELALKKGWRNYSLKSVAEKLGISSMELKRIEEMNKSSHFIDPRFLKKVSEILNLSITYIEDLLGTSFPRGDKRKEAVSKVSDQVHCIKEGGEIKGIIVLKVDLKKDNLEQLQERIKSDIDILHSKSSRK
jgi:transcriptional regulator with XRE-family HTH domain